MKNAYAISSLSRQMVKVCEQIDSLAMGVQDTEQGIGDLGDTYQNLLLDELEQMLFSSPLSGRSSALPEASTPRVVYPEYIEAVSYTHLTLPTNSRL